MTPGMWNIWDGRTKKPACRKRPFRTLEQVVDLQNLTDEQTWVLPTLAAAYANPTVGRMDDAQKVVKTILSREPKFSIAETASRCPYKTKEQIDRYVNALRRAGLPE